MRDLTLCTNNECPVSSRCRRKTSIPSIGSESAKLGNAKNNGKREGIAKCADQLQVLLNLLATDDRKDELSDKCV